jgi:hypothetical protein
MEQKSRAPQTSIPLSCQAAGEGSSVALEGKAVLRLGSSLWLGSAIGSQEAAAQFVLAGDMPVLVAAAVVVGAGAG